jgi:hypothetical protein
LDYALKKLIFCFEPKLSMGKDTKRLRELNELKCLIEETREGWGIFLTRGLLNSEGRKVCARIGSLAGRLFPERSYNVKRIIGDGSDYHIDKVLNELYELILCEFQNSRLQES